MGDESERRGRYDRKREREREDRHSFDWAVCFIVETLARE